MAVAEGKITKNCLAAIFNDPDSAASVFPVPVLQCLQVKALSAPGSAQPDRWRIVVSDTRHFTYGMLATQANHVIHENKLQRNSLIRIKAYQANSVKGKNVLIVLDLDVLEEFPNLDKIGEPAALEAQADGQSTANTGPPAAITGQNFYGAKQEPTQDIKPKIQGAPGGNTTARRPGAGAPGETWNGTNIYPIEAVSLYAQRWTIKARVTNKSEVRRWQKPNSEGKLFSVNLLDESGEIKMTGFNDQVDQFYDVFQEGSVYYISTPCKVAMAKKQFTNLPHDFELTLEQNTVVEKAEDQASVPQIRFNFCSIQDLERIEKDSTVDAIGILKDAGNVEDIKSSTTGRVFEKRELTIVDDTGYSVRVTVWGKVATNFDAQLEQVVAFKGVKVSDFGGRSLSLLSSGNMVVDPDITEAHRIKGWYDSASRPGEFATHSTVGGMGAATGRRDVVKTVAQVKDENLGFDKDEYFSLKATVMYLKPDNPAYPACATAGCNKKVTETTEATWHCEKCSADHERPNYRYILPINVSDHTGQLWLSCFDDSGAAIMGRSANDLMELGEERAKVFEAATCNTYMFRVRAKMDNYGDSPRVRYQVMSATDVDFKKDADRLQELINQYNAM